MKKKFKKITGGTLTTSEGKTFRKGDIFEVDEKTISKVFLKELQVLEVAKQPKSQKQEKEEKKPTQIRRTRKK